MIKTTIAAALLSLTTLAAMPAQASGTGVQVDIGPGWSDNGHGWDRDRRDHHRRHDRQGYRMSNDEIRSVLRMSGFRQIRFLDDSGPVSQVIARRHGNRYFLTVRARDGEILSTRRI